MGHRMGTNQATNEPTNNFWSAGAQDQDETGPHINQPSQDDRADDPTHGRSVERTSEKVERLSDHILEIARRLDITGQDAILLRLDDLRQQLSRPGFGSSSGLTAASQREEDTKWLLCSEAIAFLKEVGEGRRFCILDAKTENIIAANPDWLEATGLSLGDVATANASSGSGIRQAVTGGGLLSVGQHAPPELKKFLEKPDDIFVPQKVTESSIKGFVRPGPVLFQNLHAGALPNEANAPVVPFPYQWHKEDNCAYTGYTAIWRLFSRDKDGTDVLAYLLELRSTEKLYLTTA
eukprot:g3134.t1